VGLMNCAFNPQGFDPVTLRRADSAIDLVINKLGGSIEGGAAPLGLRKESATDSRPTLQGARSASGLGLSENNDTVPLHVESARWRSPSLRARQLIDQGVLGRAAKDIDASQSLRPTHPDSGAHAGTQSVDIKSHNHKYASSHTFLQRPRNDVE
jgi:hypothetical protein